jgi:LAS superfamily LD-carboxypeptidase LdcB
MAHIESRIASIATLTAPTRPSTTTATGGSFASTLANAVATTTGSGVQAGTAKLNANGVPVDLAAYGNGKIPSQALRSVGGTDHKLWAPASVALESLLTAARRDGVQIGINDSYRSYAEQVDMVRRKGLYSQGGFAAKPGTSDHGWGMAVDLDLNPKAQAWMRANAGRFGFVEDTPREPWHWAYTPKA